MLIYMRSYGCQMNERDSEAMAAALVERGHVMVEDEAVADVLLYNTCSVREQAERKAVGKLGILRRLKRERPEIIIGVMGCMAQRRGEDLLRELPHLDFVLGTEQLHQLPEIVEREAKARSRLSLTGGDHSVLDAMGKHLKDNRISSFISVMRGCDMFCSYCIVPYVRGRELSRSPDSVVVEAEELVADGVKEITLLGQNVSAYGLSQNVDVVPDASPFAALLRRLDAIPGLRRLRFTSPHPWFFNDDLVEAICSLPKVCDNIHLPLQSGSDAILKRMNRRYGVAKYLDVVAKLKAGMPDVTFSTDVIVAYPGETEADFAATRSVMDEVGFDNAYIFKYSPREGTPAATEPDQLPDAVKEERNQILLADLAERTARHNAAQKGRTVEVMAEGVSKRNASRWTGRTTTNRVVVFEPVPGLAPGDLVEVAIQRSTPMTLFGSIKGLDQ